LDIASNEFEGHAIVNILSNHFYVSSEVEVVSEPEEKEGANPSDDFDLRGNQVAAHEYANTRSVEIDEDPLDKLFSVHSGE
jgi:hypothetical protein